MAFNRWANAENWTRDLFLTKEALYHWATPASDFFERETGFEPATFSLEGWRSTNWATPALLCGESRIRTFEGKNQQIYSLSSLAAWVSPQIKYFVKNGFGRNFLIPNGSRVTTKSRTMLSMRINQDILWVLVLHAPMPPMGGGGMPGMM